MRCLCYSLKGQRVHALGTTQGNEETCGRNDLLATLSDDSDLADCSPSCCTALQQAQADPGRLALSKHYLVATPSTHNPYTCCHFCSDTGLPVHHCYCCFDLPGALLSDSADCTTHCLELETQLRTDAAAPAPLETTRPPWIKLYVQNAGAQRL
jgi:hypothetical protein